jgi:transposase
MMQNDGDFTAKECQVVMKYIFLKGNSAKMIYIDISVTLYDKRPFYSTVKKWVARFRTGSLSTEDKERSGIPTQVTVPENVDAIHSMILDDRKISAKNIPETLVLS